MKIYLKQLSIVSIAMIIYSGSISINIQQAEARRGCCSWHKGVCGCSCCDGTPLSAKCAPYYPHCNSTPVYKPTPKPKNYKCKTMMAMTKKGVWIFAKPSVKSKVLVKLKNGHKLIATGKYKAPFYQVVPVIDKKLVKSKITGWAHKNYAWCP